MRKIELTKEEVKSIIAQLENNIVMAKCKNMVYFFEGKLREAEVPEKVESKKEE